MEIFFFFVIGFVLLLIYLRSTKNPPVTVNGDTKTWDFGSAQPKLIIDSNTLTLKILGGTGVSYPMSVVNGIEYEKDGIVSSKIWVICSGGTNKYATVPKNQQTEDMIKDINQYIASHSSRQKEVVSSNSKADELTKLFKLKESGAINDEEYNSMKSSILAS